jgi:opacity protein-like surface antigen
MKTVLLALCAAALAAVTVFAADVSGGWNVDGDVVGNPVKFAVTFKQDGEALTGTATLEGKDTPVTGSAKEKAVTFEFDTENQGTAYHLVFTGTLGDDGGMKGSIAVAGVEGTFTATKQ